MRITRVTASYSGFFLFARIPNPYIFYFTSSVTEEAAIISASISIKLYIGSPKYFIR